MAFGGRSWPIDPRDMNFGQLGPGSSTCVGGIVDIQASNQNTDVPYWIVGDTFFKNVYSVFRFQPPAIGFAELSIDAGGSSGECDSLTGFSY